MEVNADLYDFLKEHETSLYTTDYQKNKIVFAIVFVDFRDLSDFVEIVGDHHFEEGGMDVTMRSEYICVELNDIIEGDGHYISNYRNCFDDDTWNLYEEKIKEMEGKYVF